MSNEITDGKERERVLRNWNKPPTKKRMKEIKNMVVNDLGLTEKEAIGFECFSAIRRFEDTENPISKRYWKREAERLHKQLKQMEKGE